jgi:hypothetical protein
MADRHRPAISATKRCHEAGGSEDVGITDYRHSGPDTVEAIARRDTN